MIQVPASIISTLQLGKWCTPAAARAKRSIPKVWGVAYLLTKGIGERAFRYNTSGNILFKNEKRCSASFTTEATTAAFSSPRENSCKNCAKTVSFSIFLNILHLFSSNKAIFIELFPSSIIKFIIVFSFTTIYRNFQKNFKITMAPPPLCATHFGKLSEFDKVNYSDNKNIAKGCKTTAFGKLFIFNHLQFSAKLQVFLKLQKIFFRAFSPLLLRHLHPITIGTSVIAIVVHRFGISAWQIITTCI